MVKERRQKELSAEEVLGALRPRYASKSIFLNESMARRKKEALAFRRELQQRLASSATMLPGHYRNYFSKAINHGLVGSMAELVRREPSLVSPQDDYYLHQALIEWRKGPFRFLVKKGANVRSRSDEALLIASAREGWEEEIDLILDHGGDIHAGVGWHLLKGYEGATREKEGPLFQALSNNRPKALRRLIARGGDFRLDDGAMLFYALDNNLGERSDILVEAYESRGFSLPAYHPWSSSGFTRERRLRQLKAWKDRLGLPPPDGVMDYGPEKLDPALMQEIAAWLREEDFSPQEVNLYAYRAALFWEDSQTSLRYIRRHAKPAKQPLHDLFQALVLPETWADLEPESREGWREGVMNCGPGMGKLVKFADKMRMPLPSIAATREALIPLVYHFEPRHRTLAELAISCSYSQANLDRAIEVALSYQEHKKDIPNLLLEGELFGKPDMVWRRLPPGDPRGLFLGAMVNCCQHIAGEGAKAALHGHLCAAGGFYVLEKTDKKGNKRIVAQTWAWRGQEGELVLDSLETLGGNMQPVHWEALLRAMAEKIAQGKTGCKTPVTRLLVGKGGKTPALPFFEAPPAKERVKSGYEGTDSLKQYEIASFLLPAAAVTKKVRRKKAPTRASVLVA